MTTTAWRVLATAAAAAGVGTAGVAVPAEPAAAHAINLNLSESSARLGPAHSGLRLCRLGEDWPVSSMHWHVWGDGTLYTSDTIRDGCVTAAESRRIVNFRLCVTERWNDVTLAGPHTCTAWKQVT